MQRATTLFLAGFFILAGTVSAQSTEYIFNPEVTGVETDAFAVGFQNGARGLSGPFDLDGDGHLEFLVSQHTSGGRVHVIENTSVNTWELVYSTPILDPDPGSYNARGAYGGDLDGDGRGEIMFVAGRSYADELGSRLFVFEWDGVEGSNNYGTSPATIGDFFALDALSPSRARVQTFEVMDIDGDGQEEVLLPVDGLSDHDVFYVLSVTGDFETDGAGSTFESWNIELRAAPREGGNQYGGGSPWGMTGADLNGDGKMEITMHAWNNFNFFNFSDFGGGLWAKTPPGGNFKASPSDHVALFGGVAGDIDGDGNDEVFYPNFYTGNVSVMDYDASDGLTDVIQVDATNFAYDVIKMNAAHGIAFGDTDQDGNMELISVGPGYGLTSYLAGDPSYYIHIAEYIGSGDPKDGDSYFLYEVNTGSDADMYGFATIHRDSAGVLTTYQALQASKSSVNSFGGDPVFGTQVAFMGDADGDGDVEIAIAFQGVDDSLFVYDEVWNEAEQAYDITVRSGEPNPVRAFVRVISMDGMKVSTEENRLILPSDYVLEQNYPNPFNPTTNIRFSLPIEKAITVRIIDMTGRVVKTLINAQVYARGTHQVMWDGTTSAGVQAASGTYLYSLEYGNFRQTKTMVLIK